MKQPRMSTRKNLFIVRSANVGCYTFKEARWVHCLKSKLMKSYIVGQVWAQRIFSIVQNHANGRDGRFEKQIFYPTKGGCQRLTSILTKFKEIRRGFSKMGFIAFSQMSNSLIYVGVKFPS